MRLEIPLVSYIFTAEVLNVACSHPGNRGALNPETFAADQTDDAKSPNRLLTHIHSAHIH